MEVVFGKINPWLLMAVVAGLMKVAKKIIDHEPMNWRFWLALALGTVIGGGFVLTAAEKITPFGIFAALV